MESIISLEKASKYFDSKVIFDAAELEVFKNEIVRISGENGSGKSTLVKILAGAMNLSKGHIKIKENLSIGYSPDRFPKLPLKVNEYLNFMGRMEGLEKLLLNSRINELLDYFNVKNEMRKEQIRKLSKGTIQKISIIQAIINFPQLIILDEPFSGLDDASIKKLTNMLKELNRRGSTIIFTCHEEHIAKDILYRNLTIGNGKIINEKNNVCEGLQEKVKIVFNGNIKEEKLLSLSGIENVKLQEKAGYIIVEKSKSNEILKSLLDMQLFIEYVDKHLAEKNEL